MWALVAKSRGERRRCLVSTWHGAAEEALVREGE